MIILLITLYILCIVSLIYSGICLFRPALGIRVFQVFCRYVNWSVEPIDYPLEIKNTRQLGSFGIAVSLLLLFRLIFYW